MNESLQFLQKYAGKSALIDANLLLVYVVGRYDPNLMVRFHRTKQYAADYEWLIRLVKLFSVLKTTPNVLTEVSNLGKDLGPGFYDVLKTVVSVLEENYCVSTTAVSNVNFSKIGLTDSGILEVAGQGMLVVTADWPLWSILRSKQIDAVNINHLRQIQWGLS